MTDPAELRRGRRAPAALSLVAVDADDGEALNRYGATHGRVGGAYFWRPFDQQGTRDPRRRFFLIAAGDEPAGVASLADEGGGVVEIVAFGLVPEFIGRGIGAEALSVVVEAAWEWALSSSRSGRVWLHTSSRDHPHALRNYEARGFRIYRVERLPIEPTVDRPPTARPTSHADVAVAPTVDPRPSRRTS